MATKKKELLEQETSVSETTALEDSPVPSEDTTAPDAAPVDGEDLNALLAAMDQPDSTPPSDDTTGDLPELTEAEMFGDDSVSRDEVAAEAPSDENADFEQDDEATDDGDGDLPAEEDSAGDDTAASEPNPQAVEEPPAAKPKRTSRKKKVSDTAAEAEAPVPQADAEPLPMDEAPAEDTTAEGEPVLEDDPAPVEEQVPEATTPRAPARRRNVQTRREPSILTIRSREDVETAEDREDVIWHEIHNAYRTRRILTGQLGGIEQLDNRKTVAVVDYKGFRIIIPIKEMMINLGRSPSGQDYADLMLRQNKILGNMLGADIDFVVRGIDSKTRSVVASRREAMMRKRQIFYFDLDADGMYRVYEGRIVQARVIAVAEKVIRVEVFGVECSILARDLAWDWIGDAHERFAVGDEVLVRILSVRRESPEDLSIRADVKSTSENTDRDNLQKCRIQGKYAGKVTDVHKGVVYVRLSNGVNAVAHSCYDYRMPGKKDDVSFAVTRLDMERGVAVGIITRIIRQNL